MTKSLGQIAYETFTPEWVLPVAAWEDAPTDERCRWQAAAEAVAKTVEGPCYPKERAVIEAAREWRSKVWLRKHRIGVASGKIESNLVAALKALEAAEKEER